MVCLLRFRVPFRIDDSQEVELIPSLNAKYRFDAGRLLSFLDATTSLRYALKSVYKVTGFIVFVTVEKDTETSELIQ